MGLLTQKDIMDLFEYKEGELLWKNTRNSVAKKGEVAGCVDSSHGYKEIRVDYRRYYAHRLVWQYFNGDIPEGMSIDHINQNKSDNRIDNLRMVSHQENQRNQRIRKNNTSGVMGVSFEKRRNRWSAKIVVDRKTIHLGRFKTLTEATKAREAANITFGFHTNHGQLVGQNNV